MFDYFDFVLNSFKRPGTDGVVVVVNDSVQTGFYHVGHFVQVRVFQRTGLLEPDSNEPLDVLFRVLHPKHAQIFFEQIGFVDGLAKSK